jgi:competence protein ComEA
VRAPAGRFSYGRPVREASRADEVVRERLRAVVGGDPPWPDLSDAVPGAPLPADGPVPGAGSVEARPADGWQADQRQAHQWQAHQWQAHQWQAHQWQADHGQADELPAADWPADVARHEVESADAAPAIRPPISAHPRPARSESSRSGPALSGSVPTVPDPYGSERTGVVSGSLTAIGAFDPGRRGVKALAGVAGLVVLIAAVFAWRARPHVDPVPEVPVAVAATGTGTGPGPASAGPPGEVVVAVAGKVRKPGLVRLPAGSRVADALQAAGGAKPGTDPSLLNLARKVVDGELLLVGVSPPPGVAPAGPAGAAPAAGAPAGGPVNLNTATLADLDTLPGVGPVLAQRIIDHRAQHGGFTSVGDLRKVDGIGSSRYEQLKDLVTV